MAARRRRTTVSRRRTTRREGPGESKPDGQEGDDMLDKGAETGGKGMRTGKVRGTMRMGWTGMRLMATG